MKTYVKIGYHGKKWHIVDCQDETGEYWLFCHQTEDVFKSILCPLDPDPPESEICKNCLRRERMGQ